MIILNKSGHATPLVKAAPWFRVARENIEHPVHFEFQVNNTFRNEYVPNIVCSILVIKLFR